LDQARHGRALPRWNTHNRQCTVVVDPPGFLLDRGSTISMLAQFCPGIKPSYVWGPNDPLTASRRPTRCKAVFDVARPFRCHGDDATMGRCKAVFDVAGPAFTGSVPTSTAVSGRGGGSLHSSVAAHDDRGRCSHPLRVCGGQYPTDAPDRTPERVSARRHREGTAPPQLDCTVTPCLPALMQAPVTGASGKRCRSLPFCQPHRSRTGPCWRRSQGPTSSSKGPPTMNRAVQLATVRRAAAGPKCGRLVLRQLSFAAAAHTHTAWHARRPSPPTSDPGGTAPRARSGRRARLQSPAGDAGQRAHGALTVARSGVCR